MSDDEDPTAVFHRMYDAAAAGGPSLPWDRGAPHPLLEPWVRGLDGAGRRAIVVGAGLGSDAELLAGCGFDVVAFDVSPTAVAMARERHPASPVDYSVADLLAPPVAWARAFDLVVEVLTVQSLPIEVHERAIDAVVGFVAPAGKLIVVATARDETAGTPDGPPWPLTRAEIESFARDGLHVMRIENVHDPGAPPRWRAELWRRGNRPSACPGEAARRQDTHFGPEGVEHGLT